MSGITLHDFYWRETEEGGNKYYHLFFKENSMPCAELRGIIRRPNSTEPVYHSELWIYKVGADSIIENDLDVLKLKTQIKAAQMINEMKKIVYNDPHLGKMKVKDNEKINLLFSFYNEIVPQVANNYFFGDN